MNVVSIALLLESILNIVTGSLYLISPGLLLDDSFLESLTFSQKDVIYDMSKWFGSMVIAQAVLMLFGIKADQQTQRIIYW